MFGVFDKTYLGLPFWSEPNMFSVPKTTVSGAREVWRRCAGPWTTVMGHRLVFHSICYEKHQLLMTKTELFRKTSDFPINSHALTLQSILTASPMAVVLLKINKQTVAGFFTSTSTFFQWVTQRSLSCKVASFNLNPSSSHPDSLLNC